MYLLVAVILLVLWYLPSYLKWRKLCNFIEKTFTGPKTYPIVGTNHFFIGMAKEDIFDTVIYYVNSYRPIFRSWNGFRAEIQLVKPEYLEMLMNNQLTKSSHYAILHPWLGEGLLTSRDSKWHQHRKLITPTFHFKILDNFVITFAEKTETFLEILHRKADGRIFDIHSDVILCSLDIICETAIGVNVDAMSKPYNEYVQAITGVTEVFVWQYFHPYIPKFLFNLLPQGHSLRNCLKILHGFSNKVISDRKMLLTKKSSSDMNENSYDNNVVVGKKRLSFLDMLLEASKGGTVLSDVDIREEVDTFMFEGHDTTATAMSWTLFLLGNHPDIQEKVYEEVRNVLQNKSTPTSINELNEFKYLECVIKESLRLYPSVPFIMRKAEQDIQIDQYIIPKGVELVIQIYCLHRCPEYYPEPNKFNPDRFLPENCIGRHPYAYIPFSAGARNCIGQKFAMLEEKTILASVINKYKITSVNKPEDMKILPQLVLKPANGILVRLERR